MQTYCYTQDGDRKWCTKDELDITLSNKKLNNTMHLFSCNSYRTLTSQD